MRATWPAAAICDVADLIRGVTYSKMDATDVPRTDYAPVLRATNIQDSRLVLEQDLVFVPSHNVSAAQRLKAGDIVIATSSGSKHLVGKSALMRADWPGSFGAFCAAIRPKPNIEARYLAAFLQSPDYWKQIGKKTSGININNLRRADIESITLPVPPLAEQLRIVAEIEKQFSRLDESVTNLQRVKANLKRYKASVLKAAVEGRLVPTEAEVARREGRDFQTAADQVNRILQVRRNSWKGRGIYETPGGVGTVPHVGLPEGWCWATLEQLANVVRGGSPRPAGDPRYFGGSVPWITVGPITADESDYLRQVPSGLTEAGKERSRLILEHTLLLTNSGATLGVPKISLISGCINDGVAALLDVEYPLKRYLVQFLRTRTIAMRRVNQGAAQPNLNTSIIKAMVVPLPPPAEQARIVAEIDRLFSIINELEAEVAVSLRRAQSLRSSVLSKSFMTLTAPKSPT